MAEAPSGIHSLFHFSSTPGGFRGTKHTFYEGGVRSPFIVRWPGHVPSGKVNHKSLISALDWLPTVCSIANIPIPSFMFEGEDVSDILFGSDGSRLNPLFWRGNRAESEVAMLYGQWKLHITKTGKAELYDLELNPEEDVNVDEVHPDITASMKRQINSWTLTLPTQYAKTGDPLIPFNATAHPQTIGPPDFIVDPSTSAAPSTSVLLTSGKRERNWDLASLF